MPDRVKPPIEKLTAHQILALVGLVALVAITLIFDVDVGLVAISVGGGADAGRAGAAEARHR